MPSIDSFLLTADNFAVLAGTTVTNSGATVITGADLGLSPGSSVTGFPPGVVTPPHVQHVTDATAAQAQLDLTAAYLHFAGVGPATPIVGNLAGQTFFAGIYSSATTIDLSVGGTVILDAQGDPNATFIFQAGSALNLNVSSVVQLANGAQAKNVVWQVTSSAVIGTSAVVVGDILALTSISLGTGASLAGRALARNGAVTLLGNAITAPAGSTPIPPTPVLSSTLARVSSLSEICFPDITGKTIRAWGLVTMTPGGYTVGGIPFGLVKFADDRTVDFNGFLNCEVYGEEPVTTTGIRYHYSPVNDALQIFVNGVELVANQVVPAFTIADILLFEAQWDRTSVRG